MVWEVVWSAKSVKQLGKIDKKNTQKIYDSVLDCIQDPFKTVIRLTNSPFYRLRIGSYRVILDLQQNKMIIFVVETDHRGRIYKK
ncbi:MAG: type II toxin-antitoxin system RelE/ParE family toxin [Nitrosopumilus sp.]|jgi:mRNA interferase RelE/StbE|nr:type II toxin-antitoxin system RelE/ParE family toxin [Nitrosopumilus sp.]MDF2422795.1 type II toxin-antitoxin system RelE/ParE family toxin [Nitrosopumilus sp.]MDF2423954.1 type II toxin-antitoxin system RelE/ParE family toxin [Nitrosopumilus sp.]MDF2425280.1 type II toxin-antitoxin system RelE/ParE family toxin [Nitrosopumilus sp.]MDF2427214.1 type II toxin-antitoxin system RelE/ParE family toxin [Nitrosopumilus sp.]